MYVTSNKRGLFSNTTRWRLFGRDTWTMPAKNNKKPVIRFSLFYKRRWKSRYNQRNGLSFFHCVALNTPSLHPCHTCCIPSVRPRLTLVSSRYTADTLSPSRQQTNSFLVWSTYAFVVHGLWYLLISISIWSNSLCLKESEFRSFILRDFYLAALLWLPTYAQRASTQ